MLGSGLAGAVRRRIAGETIPYARLHAPTASIAGQTAEAIVGMWAGRRVVAFCGRAHLYQGYSPDEVTYLVRLTAAAGARTIVLTNAAGALNADFASGDVMLVADHLNLTGRSPIAWGEPTPFVDMSQAYAEHLRAAARGDDVREGVYAGVLGPQYETPAESEALRRLGADAVGMSTVLETIAARALGLDVLGLSLLANAAGADVTHDDVLAASATGSEKIAAILERVLERLPLQSMR
ncbi:MAG: purine-nucleoside phosphorylase [Vulcanimicrobiaceae bacterium]